MRVLLAVDKFKGSLSANEVAEAMQRGLQQISPDVDAEVCPIADGGEGTTEAVVTALRGVWRDCEVPDALGRPIRARYGLVSTSQGRQAVIEMSAASGLAQVLDRPLQPERASTFGTGQVMLDALQQGAEHLLIGLGGSATNDGGSGMAQALGFGFTDASGDRLEQLPLDLPQARRIDASGATPLPPVQVACDVTNPLLGEQGATRVYGPQKGVTDPLHDVLEARMAHLADLVQAHLEVDPRHEPGAGAAGGLGFGLMAFCRAELSSGFELVADLVGLGERIAQADLVITGEGRIDAQTLNGKGPVGVARLARQHGKPVIGIAGSVEADPRLEAEFDLLQATKPEEMPLEEAIARGADLIEETVVRNAERIRECLPG